MKKAYLTITYFQLFVLILLIILLILSILHKEGVF